MPSHRIILSEKASKALQEMEKTLRASNGYFKRCQHVLVSEIIVEFHTEANARKLLDIADRILPIDCKRKALLKRMETLTEGLDSTAIDSVENSIKKICSSFKKSEKPHKTAEKSMVYEQELVASSLE